MILLKHLPSGLLICTNVTSLCRSWGVTCWRDPWFPSLLVASCSLVPSLLSLAFNFTCFTNFASHWHCLPSILVCFSILPPDLISLSIVLTPIYQVTSLFTSFRWLPIYLSFTLYRKYCPPLFLYTSPRLQANKSISHYIVCSYIK